MSDLSQTPPILFRAFLNRAQDEAWLGRYQWTEAGSFDEIKKAPKNSKFKESSRTHKKGTDGRWWMLEVEASDDSGLGVDLECLMDRPILSRPEWIKNRLGIQFQGGPQKILEEWTAREAAFKALAPHNQGIFVSHFKRVSPGSLSVQRKEGDLVVHVKSASTSKWVLSLAWKGNSR